MTSLIETNKADPFDRTKPCQSLISNKVIQEIMETLQEVEHKKTQIEQTKFPVWQGTQTDIIVRWEKDIEKINNLQQEIDHLGDKVDKSNTAIHNLKEEVLDYTYKWEMNHTKIHALTKRVAIIDWEKSQLSEHAKEAVQFYEFKIRKMGSAELMKRFKTLSAFFSKTDNWIVQMRCLQMWEQMMHKLLFILYKKPKVDITKWYSDRKCQATPRWTSRGVGIVQPEAVSISVGSFIEQVDSSTQHEVVPTQGFMKKMKKFLF